MIADHDRSGWIGASDVQYVIGNWKTKTWEKWWMQKLGINQDHFDNQYTLAGTNWEHRILDSLHIPGLEKDRQCIIEDLLLRVNLDGNTQDRIKEVKTYQWENGWKEHRKKRSLDANAMLWSLINQMSVVLRIPPYEIYQGYIPDVGDNYTWHPEKPEAVKQFSDGWCRGHIGRMVDDVGPCRLPDLRGYRLLKCYYGSSEYDVPTFSRLLDLVIQDCKNIGIETISERERSLLLEEWGKAHA